MTRQLRMLLRLTVALACTTPALAGTLPGYSLHYNFVRSQAQAAQSVREAVDAGAGVVSLVPPSHVWESPQAVRALDAATAEAGRRNLRIVLSRMDATQPDGNDWLFAKALTQRGRLPDGRPTGSWYYATVGNHAFERWQRDETSYYTSRYGKLPNLMAAAVGGMVEPFISQRGSLLAWDDRTRTYEIAQYTSQGMAEWHRWLKRRFGSLEAINKEYGTRFRSIARIPMPRSGSDRRFGIPRVAYFDLAQCLNDWFLAQYRENRALWHRGSAAPFLLQFSGFVSERIARGRPELAALDLPAWLDGADGLGISAYTYADYPDWGHAPVFGTLQLLLGARESGKMAIVMESGAEAPRVTVEPHELSFATQIGMVLDPRAVVYEYFRYSRDGRVDPGMMLTPAGKRHEPGYSRVSSVMTELAGIEPKAPQPCFHYLSVPLAARMQELAGRINRAVYQLAGSVPCRLLPWKRYARVPEGSLVLLPPGAQRAIPQPELRSLLDDAARRRVEIASDGATCKALQAMDGRVVLRPLHLNRLMSERYVENEAAALLEELRQVLRFRELEARQPLEPRPGVCWLRERDRLRIWCEDTAPVTLHADQALKDGIRQIWCSTRSGKPAVLVLQHETGKPDTRSLPCREWRQMP